MRQKSALSVEDEMIPTRMMQESALATSRMSHKSALNKSVNNEEDDVPLYYYNETKSLQICVKCETKMTRALFDSFETIPCFSLDNRPLSKQHCDVCRNDAIYIPSVEEEPTNNSKDKKNPGTNCIAF